MPNPDPMTDPGELLEAFKPALAAFVDGLMAHVDVRALAALDEMLAGDVVTLRLAVNVAPDLSVALYAFNHDTPPRVELIASYGTEPPTVDGQAGLLN